MLIILRWKILWLSLMFVFLSTIISQNISLPGFPTLKIIEQPFELTKSIKLYLCKFDKKNKPSLEMTSKNVHAEFHNGHLRLVKSKAGKNLIYCPFGMKFYLENRPSEYFILLNDYIDNGLNACPAAFAQFSISEKIEEDVSIVSPRVLVEFITTEKWENYISLEKPTCLLFLVEASSMMESAAINDIKEQLHDFLDWIQVQSNLSSCSRFSMIQYSKNVLALSKNWICFPTNPNNFKRICNALKIPIEKSKIIRLDLGLSMAISKFEEEKKQIESKITSFQKNLIIISNNMPNLKEITNNSKDNLNSIEMSLKLAQESIKKLRKNDISIYLFDLRTDEQPYSQYNISNITTLPLPQKFYEALGVEYINCKTENLSENMKKIFAYNSHQVLPSKYGEYITGMTQEQCEQTLRKLKSFLLVSKDPVNGILLVYENQRIIYCDLYNSASLFKDCQEVIFDQIIFLLQHYQGNLSGSESSLDNLVYAWQSEVTSQIEEKIFYKDCYINLPMGNYRLKKLATSLNSLYGFACFLGDNLQHIYMIASTGRMDPK